MLKSILKNGGIVGTIIVSMSITTYLQHKKIKNLTQELMSNEKITDKILLENNRLLMSLEQEKQAVISSQKFAKALQEKTNETKTIVKTILKTEPCANTRLPNAIINRLHKGNN